MLFMKLISIYSESHTTCIHCLVKMWSNSKQWNGWYIGSKELCFKVLSKFWVEAKQSFSRGTRKDPLIQSIVPVQVEELYRAVTRKVFSLFLTTDFTAPSEKWTVGQGQENRDICVDARPFGCLVQALTDAVTVDWVQFTKHESEFGKSCQT